MKTTIARHYAVATPKGEIVWSATTEGKARGLMRGLRDLAVVHTAKPIPQGAAEMRWSAGNPLNVSDFN